MKDSIELAGLREQLAEATTKEARKRLHGRIRARRLAEARERGRHTEYEWRELVHRFDGRCVRCGCTPIGGPCMDHIKPIFMGGSDGIENLQPLCRECNSSKTSDTTNWVAYRNLHGFLYEDAPEPRF